MLKQGMWPPALTAVALGLIAALWSGDLAAQQTGTVGGRVMTTAGEPVSGAQVQIPDLGLGALTSADGRFEITSVRTGTWSIRVVVIGYSSADTTVTVTAGQTAIANFTLAETAVQLEGLVVTALGISRQERALGYSVQNVSGDEMNKVPQVSMLESLAGKAAGLQVTNSGPMGGSTRIVLRGESSLSGNNQPLIVLDGVPLNNDRPATGQGSTVRGGSGIDYGNAAQDLDPDNIESISVLKGANAAALYGARAANGVILITTRSGAGSGGFQVDASSTFTLETPLKLPAYQNVYGGGSTPTGYEWIDGLGTGLNDGVDESWGPAIDGRSVPQWWTNGTAVPFLPHAYNVRSYFVTGSTLTNNFSVTGSSERAHARFSFLRMGADGMTPGQTAGRTQISTNAGVDFTDRFHASGSFQYTKNEGHNRPQWLNGSYSPLHIFSWFQRQVNVGRLEQEYYNWDPNAGYLTPNWNHNYHDNVYWLQYAKNNDDTRDRITGQATVDYAFNDWLSAQVRGGTDFYDWRTMETYPFYSQDTPEGGFNQSSIYREEINIDGLLTGQRDIAPGVNLRVSGGANWRRNAGDQKSAGTRRLKVPGIYNVSNSVAPPVLRFYETKKEVQSLYGLASLAYNDYLFLDVTARNDWSSTLPESNNSYFYPSVSTSVVFTDLLKGLGSTFTYGKLRASWARVGNDADPYQLAAVYNEVTPFNGVPGFTAADEIPNRNLRPEQTDSWELGADIRFAQDRAALDFTYYNSHTKDQILGVTVSDASGYGSRILNAGEIRNSGIEVLLNTTLMRQRPGGVGWDVTTNFAKNSSEVISLFEGLDALQLGTQEGMVSCCGVTVEARPGQKYGALVGTVWATDEQGRTMVSAQGVPLVADDRQILGYFQPDWMGGIRNTIRYAGVDIAFQIDHRQGGQIVCGTCQLGRRTGILAETADYGRENGIVVPGVLPDGSANTIAIGARAYARALNRNMAAHTYDATWTKLREVSIGFALPQSLTDKMRVASGRVSIVGRNLWLWSNVPHIDPETGRSNGNYQGVEFEQFPTARSVGITVSLRR